MKKLLLSVAALTFAAGSSAFAADLRMPVKAPQAPPPPVVSWTGCYIDGGVGYGFWNQEHTTSTLFGGVPGTTIKQTDGGRGWLGRVGAGCDYQFTPRFLIGVFGDYDFMDLTGNNSPLEVQAVGPGFFPINATEKESAAWSVGGRIGYLIAPSVLSYVDGGWTQARFDAQTLTTNLGAPIGFGFPRQTYDGWFIGGGFETSLADYLPGLPQGLFLRTEYRFAQYQRKDLNEITLATGLPDGNIEHTQPFVQTVTTSLVWRFNFWGR